MVSLLIVGVVIVGLVYELSILPRIANLEAQYETVQNQMDTLTSVAGGGIPIVSSTRPYAIYMQISSMPGEVAKEGHKEWIEINSFSWGVGRGISIAGPSLLSANEFIIIKTLDKSSPKLMEACSMGVHIPMVMLELVNGSNGATFMKYALKDVVISSYRIGLGVANASSAQWLAALTITGDRPVEAISLSFAEINWTYTVAGNQSTTESLSGGLNLR